MKIKAFPQEFDQENITERHVGIENELEYNGGGEDDGWRDDPDCDCSICEDERSINRASNGDIFKHPFFREWHSDGGGREFTTIPIRLKSIKQKKGGRYFHEYYELLKADTEPIDSGGTHIHISILDNDHENMESNATALAIAFFPQFQKIAGRRNSTWAPRLNKETIEGVKSELRYCKRQPDQYNPLKRRYSRMMTMLNPTGYQTLEWRGPKGSNDVTEILAWIDFIETVVKVANRESINNISFKSLLRTKRVKEYVKDMFTPEELNQRVNVSKLIGV